MTRFSIVAFLPLLCAGALCSACGSGEFTPTLENPWAPATHEFDPDCETGCEELFEIDSPHMGTVSIVGDLDRDDAVIQWGRCFGTFFTCWGDGRAVMDCIDSATCPQPCKDEVNRIVAGSTDEDVQLDAFEAVFLNEDAPCSPPADEVQP